ncbi:sulfur oxidation c-type cytochrome SoxX [Aquicoccus sp. G2-2]|uniref:sulfur oxidation c-type cytochrome SoxX n=1 Tax=Aquicoccus sp. G2-2 TaxID=3092120 RepID=UPI002AE08845|nr:sulfur oxidation c-type cytochrome SoxX [Aquicoccus sp. G2-2]MEA1113266.1 sulfur oxidation c-type cytochrome SoxX [Aquicoccus sp. G2-2]
MKLTALTLAAALLAGTAMADGMVAPSDVKFDGSAVDQALTGTPGDPVEGQSIYASKKKGNCVACHKISSVDANFPGNVGPPLDGVGDRYSTAELRGLLVDSKKTFDGTVMPAYYKVDGFIRPGKAYTGTAADDTFGPLLSAQQVEDVVAFLSTLKDE